MILSLKKMRGISSHFLLYTDKSELKAMAKQFNNYWFVQFDFPDENGKPFKSSRGKMFEMGN